MDPTATHRPSNHTSRPAAKLRRTSPVQANAPAGYRLVDEASHIIGVRDLVFVGGTHGDWRPARRSGDAGSLRRDCAALGVATLDS